MPYSPPADERFALAVRPWLFFYGPLLSAVAGFVNVVLLGIYHVPVSHMSGAVSHLGIDLSGRNLAALEGPLAIFFAFLAGAVLSGIVVGGPRVRPGRRYGVAMMLEGVLLGAAALVLLSGNRGGVPLAAMACGLQNAMASSYCGLILRTTHVTGIVTDIGVMIGQLLRRRMVEAWKFLLLSSILGGFFFGGLAGGLAYTRWGIASLFLVSCGCLAVGLLYYLWRRRRLHLLSPEPLDRTLHEDSL